MTSVPVRNNNRWTATSVGVHAENGDVVVTHPCGDRRRLSPNAAREIALKLHEAANQAEQPIFRPEALSRK